MRWPWILVAAIGCGPSRPEKLTNPTPIPREPEVAVPVPANPPELVPRPTVVLGEPTHDVPVLDYRVDADFHDALRWPLTAMNHPVLEPKFPIAQAFAKPGVGWLELCKPAVLNRYGGDKELLEYLRGWCKAVDGDVDAACSHLAPLINTTNKRLRTAVKNDLANVLAQGHADDAEHYIRVYALRDIDVLDLLAANYVEVGTNDDALAINRAAMDADDQATSAIKCTRLTKQIILSEDKNSALLKQMEAVLDIPKGADSTCVDLARRLRCWARGECAAYKTYEVVGTSPALIDAHFRWSSAKTTSDWLNISAQASTALLEAGAKELALAALQNAVRTELWYARGCTNQTRVSLREYGNTLIQASTPAAPGDDTAEQVKRLFADCKLDE